MKQIKYLFIQLWAPRTECSDPEKPHYVTSFDDGGSVQWTLTREFEKAHNFKKLVTAERVVRGVRRIAERITRGWLFEIIQVEETIVESNVPEGEKKSA